MALRHLLPSALLPSWDRETLSYSSQPHHPAFPRVCRDPCKVPGQRRNCPLPAPRPLFTSCRTMSSVCPLQPKNLSYLSRSSESEVSG